MSIKHAWSHSVIRTPIDTINIIGAGGIDQGTITELAGPPGSGKSAYAYDTAANFLEDNKDGVVVILDPELSTNLIRLEFTFKIDMTRVIIKNARTLESGYFEIYRITADQDKQAVAKTTVDNFLKDWDLKAAIKLMKEAELEPDLSLLDETISSKEIIAKAQRSLATLLAFRGLLRPPRPTPVLVIWDTIAASKPQKEVEAAMEGKDPRDAGGMGLRARINETNLAIVMSSLYNKPVTVFLLNQIRAAGIGTYHVTETSSGGNALKHAAHYYFWFSKNKKTYDDSLKMYIGSDSKVSVRKSKFGPTIDNIQIYINDQVGGKIISDDEAAMVAVDLGILYSTGGWWKLSIDKDKSYRWESSAASGDNYISRNSELRELLLNEIARHFRKNYYTLNIVYEKLGLTLGKLSDKDLEERKFIFERNVSRPVLSEKGEVKEDKEEVKDAREESGEAVEDVFELDPDDIVNDDTPIILTEDPIILDENV
jgi:RecA/RadA recombinase